MNQNAETGKQARLGEPVPMQREMSKKGQPGLTAEGFENEMRNLSPEIETEMRRILSE